MVNLYRIPRSWLRPYFILVINRRIVGAGLLFAVWQFLGCSKISDRTEATASSLATVAYETAHRKIYQFSVIPGGAYSPEELARSRRIDPVIAAHYADFGDDVHVARLTQDELVYVSYRKQNKVYWTQKKHRVCQGEAILTDGKNQARTRCGNRLSKTPRLPIGKTEPTATALNGPVVPPPTPGGPAETGAMPGPGYTPGTGPADSGAGSPVAPVESPRVATGASPGLGPPLSSYPAVTPFFGGGPLAFPSPLTSGVGTSPTGGGSLPPPSGGGTTTPPTGGGTTTPVIPATPVPEPASLFLLLSAGLGFAVVLRIRKRRVTFPKALIK
jgi:hypothetical protein